MSSAAERNLGVYSRIKQNKILRGVADSGSRVFLASWPLFARRSATAITTSRSSCFNEIPEIGIVEDGRAPGFVCNFAIWFLWSAVCLGQGVNTTYGKFSQPSFFLSLSYQFSHFADLRLLLGQSGW